MSYDIRALDGRHITRLLEMVHAEPIRNCYVASRLDGRTKSFLRNSYSDVLGYFEDGILVSALLCGANVVPICSTAESRVAFTQVLARQGRRCSSIVGPVDEVLDLWTTLEPHWGKAREIRRNQPVMAMSQRSKVIPDDQVRYSTPADLDVVLPACIDMFTNEVGISPVAFGAATLYRNRIADIIASRHSFVRIDNGVVVFKAEIGSVGAGVAQVQGVWVNPQFRGQGISVPAMAAVTKFVLDDIAGTASLYVNDFNTTALATYRATGYEQVDTFATVLF